MSLKYMFPTGSWGINATPSYDAPETASLTFKKGAVLIQTSGYVAEGGTNPSTIIGVALIAGQNGGSNGAVNSKYCPALPSVIFEATLDNAGASPYTSAATDLGAIYGVTKDGTTSLWFVDQAKTTTNARVVVVGFKDPVGTSQARVYCVFRESFTIYN